MTESRPFLYAMAIGDAFGMKYEFVPHGTITRADLFYGPHPKYTEYKPGHYTDDTQMSLANAGLLLNKCAPQKDDLINAWLDAFRRDPRPGYSKHMQRVMSEASGAAAFEAACDPSRGVTGGAAMRAGPFGLLPGVEEVKDRAAWQARMTHDTPAGINSAQAVALSVHFLHHSGRRRDLPGFLAKHIGTGWNAAAGGLTDDPHNGVNIVSQALKAVQGATALSDVLLKAVNQSPVSDTDTICAIAMLAASRCLDIRDDLPRALHDGLETGPYSPETFLKRVDLEIGTRFPARPLYGPPARK